MHEVGTRSTSPPWDMRGRIKAIQIRAAIVVWLNGAGIIKLSQKQLVVPMQKFGAETKESIPIKHFIKGRL
jgi:hypothetical protein